MAAPLVIPQTVHVLGSEQVASCQLCPLALPSVAPQEQVLGSVQVAARKLCMCGGSVGGEEGSVVGGVLGSVAGAAEGFVDGEADVSIGTEVETFADSEEVFD